MNAYEHALAARDNWIKNGSEGEGIREDDSTKRYEDNMYASVEPHDPISTFRP